MMRAFARLRERRTDDEAVSLISFGQRDDDWILDTSYIVDVHRL